MGKKSRAKKERANLRERRGVRILDKDDVRQLVNEVVSLFNEVPNEMVSKKLLNAFANDDAAAMDEIAAFAETFGVPLAGVRVGVTDHTTNTRNSYDLPLAAFLLDKLHIFSWFMSQPEWTKSKAMVGLTSEIVCSLEGLSAVPIKQEMATIFVRNQLRFLHELDQLEAHLANPETEWHQGSFGAGILATFKAEVESEREKAALTALVIDPASPSHIAPSREAPRQALRI